ncbi:MAG TPA: glycoside hydrolase family 57 protein [Candidatus Acidoferrales bacterium]
MKPIWLALLWHMHQPSYRDPASGRYLLPWVRLHALKDYLGMVLSLEPFPNVHVTFNLVPSLIEQLEHYASGDFMDDSDKLAFDDPRDMTEEGKQRLLLWAFQVNERLLRRWPRYGELSRRARGKPERVRTGGAALPPFSQEDWTDLQVLWQLAWMDEIYLESDPLIAPLSRRGRGFTEADKQTLKMKQAEILHRVLPAYRAAAERSQVEISTSPFYHPILPLLCDSNAARESNPSSPLPARRFRHPEDAQEQLLRAQRLHERVFGRRPAGLWPSEGSVSEETLAIIAQTGFEWAASDEGVLGRSLALDFHRDAAGAPVEPQKLYSPYRFAHGKHTLNLVFRDHYLSDLVGFVYSRMEPKAAARDLLERVRRAGQSVGDRSALVSIILDGENAWEYYPRNGREFLDEFYRLLEHDRQIRAVTVSEALAQFPEKPLLDRIVPGSWINANFNIWMGHADDIRAWDLLNDARDLYSRASQKVGLEPERQRAAQDALLAAEGSDWCWWYGPEHATSQANIFDQLYRQSLSEVYHQLGEVVPKALGQPVSTAPIRALLVLPSAYISPKIDGRVTSYFEWLGAGLYSADQRSAAMHGRRSCLQTLYYGFDSTQLYLRLDFSSQGECRLDDCSLRLSIQGARETEVLLNIRMRRIASAGLRRETGCVFEPVQADQLEAALDKVLEVALNRELVGNPAEGILRMGVSLWHSGLPLDALPAAGAIEVSLGSEAFAWPSL